MMAAERSGDPLSASCAERNRRFAAEHGNGATAPQPGMPFEPSRGAIHVKAPDYKLVLHPLRLADGSPHD